jgi:hypothetical protein
MLPWGCASWSEGNKTSRFSDVVSKANHILLHIRELFEGVGPESSAVEALALVKQSQLAYNALIARRERSSSRYSFNRRSAGGHFKI